MKYEFIYREENGLLYPELDVPQQTYYPIGKYGDLHLAYLKEHRKGTYTTLLTQFRLNEYLHTVDVQAKEQVRLITAKLAQSRGIDEKLKASDMLRWIAEMNAAKHDAEEMVLYEVVYQ